MLPYIAYMDPMGNGGNLVFFHGKMNGKSCSNG